MFSKPIFKQTLKSNLKLWIVFTLIMTVFHVALIAVFNPSTLTDMSGMVKDTPLAGLLGDATFLGMLSKTFYGIQGVLIPIVFIIMTANSLIASQVDRGSMAYLLSTPTKRSTVVRTQAVYLVMSLIVMFLIVTVSGIVSINVFQSEIDINMTEYLMLNLGLFLLMFATSGISFFFSCLFNLTKNSLAFGAGIPMAFFLLKLMGDVDSSLEGLKYVSLNTLFDTNAITTGGSYSIQFIILAVVGLALYILGMRVFMKKDLPL
ncbi:MULTISPECIES: ABC transporter permease subunit [unclassified Paenibacillus]|uniref:ABC transporter permease subunit n=1 Tax=Paenibacillus provencensis TaxID=441151 RepID=A0ABW3PST3_9BACL|nr:MULTISPECIES: ABC transporter permease subunit [unclassified Paenibacillus]MCM3129733.1 ABC-2 transporter permease [Paenibacillus sp. MER 78]SFS55074.1 ABC-2 type transport system permease protein [Paenibacillus sp. 453mf]